MSKQKFVHDLSAVPAIEPVESGPYRHIFEQAPRHLEALNSMQVSDEAANVPLIDLAKHGLLKRRDAVGVVDSVFEEALSSLEQGRNSPLFEVVGENLLDAVHNPERQSVNVHNFTVELMGYGDSRYETFLKHEQKKVVDDTIQLLYLKDEGTLRQQLQHIRENAQEKKSREQLGKYALVRAQIRQDFIEKEFGEQFVYAKAKLSAFLEVLLPQAGLSHEDIVRALEQLELAQLAAQDHLLKAVTGGDNEATNTYGDYTPGSLKIHAYLKGTTANPRSPDKTEGVETITHELTHAASTQMMQISSVENEALPEIKSTRVGVMDGARVLVRINEGLTELITRMATGKALDVDSSQPYYSEVSKLVEMSRTEPELFAAVVHSTFSTKIHPMLPRAVELFYGTQPS